MELKHGCGYHRAGTFTPPGFSHWTLAPECQTLCIVAVTREFRTFLILLAGVHAWRTTCRPCQRKHASRRPCLKSRQVRIHERGPSLCLYCTSRMGTHTEKQHRCRKLGFSPPVAFAPASAAARFYPWVRKSIHYEIQSTVRMPSRVLQASASACKNLWHVSCRVARQTGGTTSRLMEALLISRKFVAQAPCFSTPRSLAPLQPECFPADCHHRWCALAFTRSIPADASTC